MSASAINDVTRGLRMLLRSQLARVSPTALVTLLPPGDTLPETSGVNLYLYRVMEHPSFKNDSWRGDRATRPGNQPVLALQLSYLLTPLGARPTDNSPNLGDDAHLMLGVAMSALHENPVLNDVHIPDFDAIPGFDADLALPLFLRNSYEQVKVTLVPTGIDELSKIWATINKPYRLSVAYEVSLIQILPTLPPPAGGGIVTSTGIQVVTLDPPRLASLNPAQGALASATTGDVRPNLLQILGFGFSFPGQAPIVRIGGEIAPLQSTPAPTDQAITVALPTDLDAGPQADVRVTLNGRTSVPLLFTVSPWLSGVKPVRTAIEDAAPKLTLTGKGFTATPQEVRLDGPGGPISALIEAGGNDGTAIITIPAGLANGGYDVRLVVDPARANVSNARTLEVIPRVDSPIVVSSATSPDGQHLSRLTLNGARLNGTDIRLSIDGVTFTAAANVNPVQIVYTMGRVLNSGRHQVSVRVDGHASHTIEVLV